MSILTPSAVHPSYQQGFARSASESVNPGLWKGLVGAWCPSLGNTGNMLKDVSGGKNFDGTLVGATWEQPDFIRFDANTELITVPDMAISGSQLSIVALVRLTGLPTSDWARIIHAANGSGSDDWHIGMTNFGLFCTRIRTTSTTYTAQTIATPSETYSFIDAGFRSCAMTWDGVTVRMFLDGTQVAISVGTSLTGSLVKANEGGAIGRHKNSTSRNFPGDVAGGCVYSRALALEEIQEFHLGITAPFRRKRRRVVYSIPAAGGNPPVNTVPPVVTGTTQVGNTLSTTNGIWTGDPAPTYSYDWQSGDDPGGVDMASIGAPNANTYLLTANEVDKYVRCVVTGSNGSGFDEANSDPVGPIAAAPTGFQPAWAVKTTHIQQSGIVQ